MAHHHPKDVWKSITTADGVLCVTTISATSMLESLVTVLAMGKSVLHIKATVTLTDTHGNVLLQSYTEIIYHEVIM